MKILISAYACEPTKGSEPGTGWIWASRMARDNDVWVLTRTNNREALEGALREEPELRMRFIYVDLPEPLRRIKRGSRGVQLYYYLWQFSAWRAASRAHKQVNFDLIHHLTFATVSIPALVGLIGPRFVWGPVGGATPEPWRLCPAMGIRGTLYEVGRLVRRVVARYCDPLVRITWAKASEILVQNPETLKYLPRRHHWKARIQPHVTLPQRPTFHVVPKPDDRVVVIMAGRLLPWKGFALGLKALQRAAIPGVEIHVVGEGPLLGQLQRLARELDLQGVTTFHGRIPQTDLWNLLRRAHITVAPSLHEEGGFFVFEAMCNGVIPVVLDAGGPRVVIGEGFKRVPLSSGEQVIEGLAVLIKEHAASRASLLTGQRKALSQAEEFWGDGNGVMAFRTTEPPIRQRRPAGAVRSRRYS